MTESWHISANCPLGVSIWDKYFLVQSPFDILEIEDDDRKMAFTGREHIFETISANFSISFQSDGRVELKGFKLKWKCI